MAGHGCGIPELLVGHVTQQESLTPILKERHQHHDEQTESESCSGTSNGDIQVRLGQSMHHNSVSLCDEMKPTFAGRRRVAGHHQLIRNSSILTR